MSYTSMGHIWRRMKAEKRSPFFYLGYGTGDYGLNLFWNSLSLILVFWYTETVGLEPHIAGYIYFFGLVWDGISDPIVATLAERHRSRYGGYRPFLLFGGALLSLCFCLLFWRPPLEGVLLIGYLIIVHIIFRTSYTIVAVPYAALTSRLTYDSRERTLLSGTRMACAFLGLFTISFAWFPLSRYFGNGSETSAHGVFITACLASAAAFIALAICFFSVRENVGPAPRRTSIPGIFQKFVEAWSNNTALRIMLLVIIAQSAATTSFSVTYAFYIEANQAVLANKETVLTAQAVMTLVSVPFWTIFARNVGRRTIWTLATIWVALCGSHAALGGMVVISGLPIQLVAMGIGLAAFAVVLWSLIPDIVEYGQHEYGVRAEAAVFGSSLFVQKFANGLMGLAVGYALKFIGYDADLEVQTADVGAKLETYISIIPVLGLVISAFIVWRLPFNEQTHSKIVEELTGTPPADATNKTG